MSDFLIMNNTDNNEEDFNAGKKINAININNYLKAFTKIKVKEKAVFYRLLAVMSTAGLGLVKSMSILSEQEKNPRFKDILEEFTKRLGEGDGLSDCMESHLDVFGDSEIGMVRSGEKTGKLNVALKDLAEQVEKIASISGKIVSAMIYPAFIIVVVFVVIFIMMTIVVPKLLEIFGEKSELPQSTQILMGVSDVFVNYWLFMIVGIFTLIIAIIVWKRTPDGKYNFDNILLRIPVFGGILKKIILSKFSRVFSGLITSGISIVDGLKITASAVGNEVYKQRILLLAEDVSGGIKINESLDSDRLFPNMLVQMIKVGEETAKLDETVTKVADFYDEQVDNTISSINKLLEPLIIVILAVIVGLIALGIMEPIMNIAGSISE